MNLITNTYKRAVNNPHTSISAVVFIGAKFAAHFGGVWWPDHKAQFDQTAALVESAALGYGLVLAGDAGKNNKPEDNSK